jgi:hypothetical protein
MLEHMVKKVPEFWAGKCVHLPEIPGVKALSENREIRSLDQLENREDLPSLRY